MSGVGAAGGENPPQHQELVTMLINLVNIKSGFGGVRASLGMGVGRNSPLFYQAIWGLGGVWRGLARKMVVPCWNGGE